MQGCRGVQGTHLNPSNMQLGTVELLLKGVNVKLHGLHMPSERCYFQRRGLRLELPERKRLRLHFVRWLWRWRQLPLSRLLDILN